MSEETIRMTVSEDVSSIALGFEDAIKGDPGDDGVGIVSVALTDTSGLMDTYTITKTDGTTSTFTVTNGAQGIQGVQGNGISSIAKTNTEDLIDTYTITFTDNTTTSFTVANGAAGATGETGLVALEIATVYSFALPPQLNDVINITYNNNANRAPVIGDFTNVLGTISNEGTITNCYVVQCEVTAVNISTSEASFKILNCLEITGAQGLQGIQGLTGPTPVLQIGTITTLNPTDTATATITHIEDNIYAINLGLPRGATGAAGAGSGDMTMAIYDPDGDGKVVSAVNADTAANSTNIAGMAGTIVVEHLSDEDVHVTTAEKVEWNAKQDSATTLSGYGITDAYTKAEIDTALSDVATTVATIKEWGVAD